MLYLSWWTWCSTIPAENVQFIGNNNHFTDQSNNRMMLWLKSVCGGQMDGHIDVRVTVVFNLNLNNLLQIKTPVLVHSPTTFRFRFTCRRSRISYFVPFELNINTAPSFSVLTSAPHWLTTTGKHNKRHVNGSRLRTWDCSEVTMPVSRVSVRVRSVNMTKSSTSLPDMMLHKCPCCFCNRTCYTLDTCGLLHPWPR